MASFGRIAEERMSRQSVLRFFFTCLMNGTLRKAGLACTGMSLYNFFFRQYASALRRNIPVVNVEHPLDEKIPFLPRKVGVYLDFVSFWIRTAGFLNRAYPHQKTVTADFIVSIGRLYKTAAGVYAECLSTTKRPFYVGAFRFALIHAFDPHLMCIPSLHVMVVIRTYTTFAGIVRNFSDSNTYAKQAAELRGRALAITEAVLYVKQHSVNCVAAAMYAMSRFDPPLFTEQEAEAFTADLFTDATLPSADASRIRKHILDLYRRFLDQGRQCADWTKPLLAFLEERKVPSATRSSQT
ncbi:MAG: hypothetical protein LBP19_05110 [Treponema sp.]|jgi:hypothetical protein|nr:hypothetical protein [Treponema sp.]